MKLAEKMNVNDFQASKYRLKKLKKKKDVILFGNKAVVRQMRLVEKPKKSGNILRLNSKKAKDVYNVDKMGIFLKVDLLSH